MVVVVLALTSPHVLRRRALSNLGFLRQRALGVPALLAAEKRAAARPVELARHARGLGHDRSCKVQEQTNTVRIGMEVHRDMDCTAPAA